MSDFTMMIAALKRLEARHRTFKLEMPFGAVVTIVSHIQVALRHPGNQGYAAQEAQRIAEAIIDTIAEEEPVLAALLRKGFDPTYDVPRDVKDSN